MSKIASLTFQFDEFNHLPPEVNHIGSEVQTDCNGHKWRSLNFYPKGFHHTFGWTAMYLVSEKEEDLDVIFSLSIRAKNSDPARYIEIVHRFYELIKYSEVVDENKNILKDGALFIDVVIQVKDRLDYFY